MFLSSLFTDSDGYLYKLSREEWRWNIPMAYSSSSLPYYLLKKKKKRTKKKSSLLLCPFFYFLRIRQVKSSIAMFGSCKIFSSILLYFKKCFGKYFLVFGCVAENNIENTFSSCSSHFLSFQTKPNQKKLINGAIWVKKNPFVGVVGLTNGFIRVVGSSARCEWIRWRSDASGFENDGEMISPVVRRSLYSLFFLFLSLSLRVVRKWQDDLDDQWLVSTRVGLNNRNGAIFLLRHWWSSCSFSLSLFYFPRPEIIWSENENENHFPPFWLYFTVNRKCFSVWPNLK